MDLREMTQLNPTGEKVTVLCVICKGPSAARPTYAQATRTEPRKPLGWQAYCRACDLYFPTPAPKLD